MIKSIREELKEDFKTLSHPVKELKKEFADLKKLLLDTVSFLGCILLFIIPIASIILFLYFLRWLIHWLIY